MAQLYVPDQAYLICTDGMMMQQLIVKSQHSIKIASGKLAGTIDDRTGGNFICAKMVVAGAIAGVILAAIVVATAPVSIGIGAALAIGAAAGAVTGGLLASIPCTCALLTMPKDWAPVHPKVKFEKKEALIETSMVPCILGGNVLIHYSEEAAQAAIDITRKKTAFNVAFIIASAYLAGPALEGLLSSATTAVGIFKSFGWVALSRHLGSVGIGLTVNYALDSKKDDTKDYIYQKTGIDKYLEEPDSDILHLKQGKDVKDGKQAEPESGIEYDDVKRTTESMNAGTEHVGDRTGTFETTSTESRTVLNSTRGNIEEYNSTTASSSTPGAIPERNTSVNTSTSNEFESGSSGTYMRSETHTHETGREYRPLDASGNREVAKTAIKSWGKDYFSKPKIKKNGISGGGLVIDLILDAYTATTNYVLKDDIKDYLNAMNDAENKAKDKIKVQESDI